MNTINRTLHDSKYITQLTVNVLINELMNSSNYFINRTIHLALIFVTNYFSFPGTLIALRCSFGS